MESPVVEKKAGLARALIDIKKFAYLCDCSSRHLRRQVDLGRAPRPVKIGNALRWRLEYVLAWLRDGCPRVSQGGRRS